MPAKIQIQKVPPLSKCLYRYLWEERYAKEFVEGHIFLSTLEYVRKGDAMRADPGDAHMTYSVSNLRPFQTGKEAEEIRKNVRETGILEVAKGVGLINMSFVVPHPDAYVLCMSRKANDRTLQNIFGKFCVEINDPVALFVEISQALAGDFDLVGAFAQVSYDGRSFKDIESRPGHNGFASTPANALECEERMIWLPHGDKAPQTLNRIHVDIPAASKYCRIV